MSRITVLDGSTGRQLIQNGMPDDEVFAQLWSAKALVDSNFHGLVVETHRSYIDVGADAITTNSYCVQPTIYQRYYKEDWRERMLEHAELSARLAVQARQESAAPAVRVLGCLPPLVESHRPDLFAKLLEEKGEAFYMEAYRDLGTALVRGGADALLMETISSWEEAALAIEGIRGLGKPMLLSLEGALRSNELTPQPHLAPEMAKRALAYKQQGVPLECLGFNCTEPETILDCLKAIEAEEGLSQKLSEAGIQLAGYANLHDRAAVHAKGFDIEADTKKVVLRSELVDEGFSGYIELSKLYVKHGATMVGGCCGCGPEAIAKMVGFSRELCPPCK